MSQNFHFPDNPLSLRRIRSILIRLEETIIFSLIERAQFALNPKIYERGAFKELRESGFEGSWLEWFLLETERFHAKARRYTSPDEYPFNCELPKPILPPFTYPKILCPNTVNVNAQILAFYTRDIVPRITMQASETIAAAKRANGIASDPNDDGNYGDAATIDVEALQAISKRVHYGKFVSESKFTEKPSDFIPHILNPNREALEALITKPAVEQQLLARLKKKAAFYGQDLGPDGQPMLNGGTTKIDTEEVKVLYEKYIIPLTKDVEVDYLLQRLDGLSEAEIEELAKK